jgi:DNA invertase Pin-like site-specific DNA recombinase
MNPKLTPERLRQKAIVYVRQSKPSQLIQNQESQRLQYGLVERARQLGFHTVSVIDTDLGVTGSGLAERPGFERLLSEVCSGEVGAVFCLEASRLARNGREWHHLIELCGMLGTVVADPDGVYDPALINDRLLLGLRGTMSEFELNLFRQRSTEAIRQKAGRGELRIPLPAGFCWSPIGKIEKDADARVQQAIELVFRKMTELGSARQVLIWMRQEEVSIPVSGSRSDESPIVVWKLPLYQNIRSIVTNPVYAGAYAFGKTGTRTAVIDGHARRTSGHHKPRSEWMVLIRDHHPGYISWDEYERNQAMIAANTHGHSGAEPKAGRGGRALLSGLLRCRRCGHMLYVAYSGPKGRVIRYGCIGKRVNCGEGNCIGFGGLRIDQVISEQVLRAVEGNAIEAALKAAAQIGEQQQELRKAIELETEQARYEARLAARRYESVDPEQRLVAKELEARWNTALQKVHDLETKLREFDSEKWSLPPPDPKVLMRLAQDLPAVWNSSSTDMRLKQRIVRILIQEIVADIDDTSREVVLLIHWAGGRHSELRVKKSETGKHRYCTSLEAIDVIRKMAGKFPDEQIATTLNRLRLRTGADNAWNEHRVYSVRHHHSLPAFDASQSSSSEYVTLEQAARRLDLSPPSVRKMIELKILTGHQIVECAPWQIPITELDRKEVRDAAIKLRNRVRVAQNGNHENQQRLFSGS